MRLADGERLAADAVVSNADVAITYQQLVPAATPPAEHRPRDCARMRYSMSLFVLYFGTDRRYEDVAHHEILMGPRYRGLLDDIFTRKTLRRRLLALPAPPDGDRSLARAAGLRQPSTCSRPCRTSAAQTDWRTAARPVPRRASSRYLEEHYLPDLSRHIVTERTIDPLHFRDTLNSYLGSAFSVEPILTQSAWFRPHNRSEDVANLYFVGAGTHPGAGLPGVLSSGKIVADMIAAEPAPTTVHRSVSAGSRNAES